MSGLQSRCHAEPPCHAASLQPRPLCSSELPTRISPGQRLTKHSGQTSPDPSTAGPKRRALVYIGYAIYSRHIPIKCRPAPQQAVIPHFSLLFLHPPSLTQIPPASVVSKKDRHSTEEKGRARGLTMVVAGLWTTQMQPESPSQRRGRRVATPNPPGAVVLPADVAPSLPSAQS